MTETGRAADAVLHGIRPTKIELLMPNRLKHDQKTVLETIGGIFAVSWCPMEAENGNQNMWQIALAAC